MRRCSIVTRPVSSASRRGLDLPCASAFHKIISGWWPDLEIHFAHVPFGFSRIGHSLLIARNDRALKSKSCALYLSFLKLRVRVCTSLKQLFFSLSDNGGRQFMTISQCNCWFKFSGDTSNFEQFLRKIWVKSTYQACKQFHEKLIYNLSLDKVSQIYSDLCLLLKRIIG